MKVEKWVSYPEAATIPDSPFGGLGGWFGWEVGYPSRTHTWQDYLDHIADEERSYAEAVKEDVLASGRFITGSEHQHGDEGVPVFDDGTCASFSYRGWADLMAAIATVKDGYGHTYMEFYC